MDPLPKASDLKKGNIVELEGQICLVRQVEAKSPSARGAATLYKVRFVNVQTRQKLDASFKGDDSLSDVAFERRAAQLSYRDSEGLHFMDLEDFSIYSFSEEDLAQQLPYLTERLEGLQVLLVGGQAMGLELPASVALEIRDTAPPIKGATASARTKTAVLATGLELQVPEYLEIGETIKVNTSTGKFMSRS